MRNVTISSLIAQSFTNSRNPIGKVLPMLSLLVSVLLANADFASAQCANNGVNLGTRNPNCGWQRQSMGPDNEACINVVKGRSYTFSFCQGGGFRGNWDTQLTGFNGGSGTTSTYNDDACGLGSEITWTANFTGSLQLNADRYACGNSGWFSGATSYVLAYRENTQALSGGTIAVNHSVVCNGGVAQFTISGQQQIFDRYQQAGEPPLYVIWNSLIEPASINEAEVASSSPNYPYAINDDSKLKNWIDSHPSEAAYYGSRT
jgi:hypothetical protein